MNIDQGTNEAIEVVSEGARLSANLLTYVFSKLADKLEKGEKDIVTKSKTVEGKQKINNLLKKHKDGIDSLEGNLTKDQLNSYKKEFNKLGVDFSIVKNGKDNYSFFFASNQANVIEKALKNVIEKERNINKSKEKTNDNKFSMKSVVKLDKEIKSKEPKKEKSKEKEQSR